MHWRALYSTKSFVGDSITQKPTVNQYNLYSISDTWAYLAKNACYCWCYCILNQLFGLQGQPWVECIIVVQLQDIRAWVTVWRASQSRKEHTGWTPIDRKLSPSKTNSETSMTQGAKQPQPFGLVKPFRIDPKSVPFHQTCTISRHCIDILTTSLYMGLPLKTHQLIQNAVVPAVASIFCSVRLWVRYKTATTWYWYWYWWYQIDGWLRPVVSCKG